MNTLTNNKTWSVFIKPTTVIWSEWFRREVKSVCQAPWSEWWMSMSHCIKCLSEHAEHPLLLQILFVECVLVGSEGMTEQNLIWIDSRRSDATTCLFVSVLSSIWYGLSRRASLFFPISSQHRDKYGKINNGKNLFFGAQKSQDSQTVYCCIPVIKGCLCKMKEIWISRLLLNVCGLEMVFYDDENYFMNVKLTAKQGQAL